MSEEVMQTALVFSAINILIILMIVFFMKKFIKICPPNKIFVFSGINKTEKVRISLTGRTSKLPIIEKMDELDLSVQELKIKINKLYSKEGLITDIEAIAYVKISKNLELITNAIDNFLRINKTQIAKTANSLIETHIREFASNLTLEEIYKDRISFSDKIALNIEDEISKLGLELDIFKIYSIKEVV